MKPCQITLLILFCASLCGASLADDATAVKYANEAVAALQANFDRLNALKSSGSLSAAQLEQLQSELLDAKLMSFRLRGNNAEVKQLLQTAIDNEAAKYKRTQALAKRGYAGADVLRGAETRLLIARQELAIETGDKEGLAEVARRAVEIEEEKLQSLIHMNQRGFTSRSAIAEQKLKIAKLIAAQRITILGGM